MEGKLIKKDDHYFLEVEPYTLNTLQRNALIANTFDKPKGDILQLSLTNCQAIERGYDLDELVKERFGETFWHDGDKYFKEGFQKALEILGDKKFSGDDMKRAFEVGEDFGSLPFSSYSTSKRLNKKEFIQSLQQTEWDVTFDPDEKDAEGRLILKRK